jgi:imidazolonepropionase-like amidohydrolase
MHLSVRFAGLAAVVAAVAPPISAQHPPVPPATWAITGARIETGAGPAIASGTVVIRDGLIAAVGANVRAPADARVIDGSGLTVYPGLIDASTSLGIPAPAVGGGGQAAEVREAPNSNYGVGMQAELTAVDELSPTATSFTAAHRAGFTAALTGSASGIFRGTSAVIALRDAPVADLVIRNGVAQQIGFSRGRRGGFGGGGGFPGSLMGVFAQLRQELLDAQHYRDLKAAFAKNPRGMARPAHDPTLEALQPVIAGTQPVVMAANSEREIIRALDLAREFGLRPIIAGGEEAWKVADRLRAENVPVLFSIDFPRRTAPARGEGRQASDESPPPESMEVLRSRVNQPKAPGVLAAAGVRFALVSGNEYGEFLANLRRAVAGGLAPERALKAVTSDAAALLGVADQIGTIETGKVANLTLVRGGLFDDDAAVTQVFVDGDRFEVAAADSPPSGAASRRGGGAGQATDALTHASTRR